MSFRSIAERLGMSVGSVQKAKKRQEKLDQEISNELDSVLAKYDGDGLAAEDVQTAADCERLNDLELHRLLKLPTGSGGRGRAKPILVVIAAIVVLVSARITGYLFALYERLRAERGPIRALDFGCGSGTLITRARERGFDDFLGAETYYGDQAIDAQTRDHEQANHKSSCAT